MGTTMVMVRYNQKAHALCYETNQISDLQNQPWFEFSSAVLRELATTERVDHESNSTRATSSLVHWRVMCGGWTATHSNATCIRLCYFTFTYQNEHELLLVKMASRQARNNFALCNGRFGCLSESNVASIKYRLLRAVLLMISVPCYVMHALRLLLLIWWLLADKPW